MGFPKRTLAIAAIVVGVYGLLPLPGGGWVSSIGAIVVGALLLTQ